MNIVLKDPKKIKNVIVTTEYFSLDEFMAVVRYGAKVEFGEDMIAAVKEGRRRIDKYLEEANTGRGLKMPRALKPYFQFVLPLLILVILIQGLLK